jgi:hypothetical protein
VRLRPPPAASLKELAIRLCMPGAVTPPAEPALAAGDGEVARIEAEIHALDGDGRVRRQEAQLVERLQRLRAALRRIG